MHVGDVFEVDFSGFVSSSSPSESKFVFELKVVSLKVEGGRRYRGEFNRHILAGGFRAVDVTPRSRRAHRLVK